MILSFGIARLRPSGLRRGSLHSPRCSERRLVEAARIEPEVDITTIKVYDDLPNVYRMKDIFMLVIKSPFQYCYQP